MDTTGMKTPRTPAKKKAKELAKILRSERPDYYYLKSVFRHLREELDVPVTWSPKKLPDVPTEHEIERYYEAVWKSQNFQDMVIIKTFPYTGSFTAIFVTCLRSSRFSVNASEAFCCDTVLTCVEKTLAKGRRGRLQHRPFTGITAHGIGLRECALDTPIFLNDRVIRGGFMTWNHLDMHSDLKSSSFGNYVMIIGISILNLLKISFWRFDISVNNNLPLLISIIRSFFNS